MSVKRTEGGRWKVRWRNLEGRELSRTFTLKRDAHEYQSAVLSAKERGHLDLEPVWRRKLRSQLDDNAEIVHDTINPHGFYVYLLWSASDDKPLYVGLSTNVLSRLGNHMSDPAKVMRVTRVTLLKCYSAEVMQALELKLIRFYNPELNIRDNLNGECEACGKPRLGLSIYCSDECRIGTQVVNRKARTAPASLTLTEISEAHRRAARKLNPR